MTKPDWWRPWHKHQLLLAVILAVNVAMGLIPGNRVAILNWICVGFCAAIILANQTIYMVVAQNRLMGRELGNLNDAMTALMQVKGDEIGAAIAKEFPDHYADSQSHITKH